MSYISAYCHISNNGFYINGNLITSFASTGVKEIILNLYSALNIKYSKFHKMDDLSKLGFIGTELIKNTIPEIDNFGENDIALLFSNKKSSATTDILFRESYQNGGIPSPSLFVYTLPNILIGEISIRNKWYGENMFTVSSDFDAKNFSDYCNILLNKNSKAAMCGWINTDTSKIKAFFFFVTKEDIKQLNLPLSSDQLHDIYSAIQI